MNDKGFEKPVKRPSIPLCSAELIMTREQCKTFYSCRCILRRITKN
jgi:hypothetical protein